MTECGPAISYDDWHTFKAGSCGKAVDRMEIAINSSDPENIVGEILVRGANVMDGYYKTTKPLRPLSTKTAGCIPATWELSTVRVISLSKAEVRT